jgi:aspartate aminotransferase
MTGLSKTYAMTGWRIGFCTGPRALIAACTVVQGTATSGVSTIGQAAAIAALTGPQDSLAPRRAAYQTRRDLVVNALNAIPGIACRNPQGAFYVFPNIFGLLGKTTAAGAPLKTDTDFATAWLNEALLATVPGAAFAYPGHIRLSTATDEQTLTCACARLAEFCAALR